MPRRLFGYALLAAVVVAGSGLWLAQRADCLVVRQIDAPQAPIRRMTVLAPGAGFDVAWEHSVERETWIETFKNIDHALWLVQTRFKTFGAGVPAQAGRRTRLVDGWVVMSGIDRPVPALAYQAAAQRAYRLRVGDGPWQALSRAGRAPLLSFSIEPRSRAARLWNHVVNHD